MYTLLLLLIYLAFISLGLPDSLLGSAWPVIHQELQVPLSYAGGSDNDHFIWNNMFKSDV